VWVLLSFWIFALHMCHFSIVIPAIKSGVLLV
jgi:hypothetical protein